MKTRIALLLSLALFLYNCSQDNTNALDSSQSPRDTLEFAGGKAIVQDLEGMEVAVLREEDFQGVAPKVNQSDFLETIVRQQTGTFLPSLQISGSHSLEEWQEKGALTLEDGSPGTMIHLVYEDSLPHLVGFYSTPSGDYGWLFPETQNPGVPAREFRFRLPLPEPPDTSDQDSFVPFAPEEGVVFRPIFFENLDYVDSEGPGDDYLIKNYHFEHLVRENNQWEFRNLTKASDWRKFEGADPVLLLFHGADGTPAIAFKELVNNKEMKVLQNRYGNRILAFAHPTIRKGVKHNARKFLEIMGNRTFQNLDILTRSRGSLVARYLLEKKDFANTSKIHRLVMLGGPNQGSHSASKANRKRTAFRVVNKLHQLRPKHLFDLHQIQEETKYALYQLKLFLQEEQLLAAAPEKKETLVPGARDQAIGSQLIRELNGATVRKDSLPLYYGISTLLNLDQSNWDGKKLKKLAGKVEKLLNKTFKIAGNGGVNASQKTVENDGINPSKGACGMLQGEPVGKNLELKSHYALNHSQSRHAHHISYMEYVEVRQAIVYFLTGTKGDHLGKIDGFVASGN